MFRNARKPHRRLSSRVVRAPLERKAKMFAREKPAARRAIIRLDFI